MSVSVDWKTPGLVDWGTEYAVAFDIHPSNDLVNCSVETYEDGGTIPPSPYFIGEVSRLGQSVTVKRVKQDWQFYMPCIGLPFRQTRKTFEYHVLGNALHNGQNLSFRGPTQGFHKVKVNVPSEKKHEGRLAFGAYLIAAAETIIATQHGVFAVPAFCHGLIAAACYEKMKDPPEYDDAYKQLVEQPRVATPSSLGLKETDASHPAGELSVELDFLNSALGAFYLTERRAYSAHIEGNETYQRRQTQHMILLADDVLHGIDRVFESQIRLATHSTDQDWNDVTQYENVRSKILEEWISTLKPEPNDSAEVRNQMKLILDRELNRLTYAEIAVRFLADLSHFRDAVAKRLVSIETLATHQAVTRGLVSRRLEEMKAIGRPISRHSLSNLAEGEVLLCLSTPEGVGFLFTYNAWGFVAVRREPKYFVLYVTAPQSRVRYFAEVERIVAAESPESPIKNPQDYERYTRGKKVVVLRRSSLKELSDPLPKGTRWPRHSQYTSLSDFISAETFDQLR